MFDEISGIILDVKEYKENDALLQFQCEEGNIYTLIARGIQKMKSKNACACQLFTYSKIQLDIRQNQSLQTLKSAQIIHSFHKIRDHLIKQSFASYMCECILKSNFEKNIFSKLHQSLQILELTSHPYRILCEFQSFINSMHGIEANVDSCIHCNTTTNITGISVLNGGFVCAACCSNTDLVIESAALKKFRLLCKAKLAQDNKLKAYQFNFQDFNNLYLIFEEYAGLNIKSYSFIKHLTQFE